MQEESLSQVERQVERAAMDRAAELVRGMRTRLREATGAKDAPHPDESRERGKSLRQKVPRSSLGTWEPAGDRPDPVALLREQDQNRLSDLLPLRYERMSASPFAFYRGGALVMASDLSRTPATGITVQACGDAHIANFGLFNSPERRTVFDINDFDETLPGPWEWDVRRLAASAQICGRDRGFSSEQCEEMALACARGYREGMRQFADMGNLDVWYAHMDVDSLQESLAAGAAGRASKGELKAADRTLERAKRKDSARAVAKFTEVVDGRLRVISDPPTLVPLRDLVEASGRASALDVDGADMEQLIGRVLAEYRLTLPPATRHLVEQYRGVDMARKVVGVGSVGTRAWIVVLSGASSADPLVLQIKEAQESVLERYCGRSAYREHGQRVVQGQRAMQTASDMLLGWCRLPGEDGRHKDYYVRQLWDGKGSIDLERLPQHALVGLCRACGWTLAHAHARTGDRFAIAGYLGKGDQFDRAMAAFSAAYADQNERDFSRFLKARERGELPGA